jgi:hypothetical protein
MKYITFFIVLALLSVSCEGPQGPPGFDGFDGAPVVAQSYEVERNFTAPNYRFRVTHPLNIEVLQTDMILVYLLWDEVPASNGGTIDVWRLLPQTVYSNVGEFSYNYEATFVDVDIFLDGPSSTNFGLIASDFVNNQVFRIVILPVDLASNPLLDITDYNSVMNLAGLDSSDIIIIQ